MAGTRRRVGAKIDEVAGYDERASAALGLIAGFGLRFKEVAMLRPHADIVTAEQAGKPAGAVTHYLKLTRGTKGGRLRYVPVDTPEREHAVARARRVAQRDDESISNPRYTLVQAIRRLRYVMERFGVTKRDLGVTPHGLRHQYAADEFSRETGEAPPVEGGRPVPKERDQAARKSVSGRLGHSRIEITNVYLGSQAGTSPAASAISTDDLDAT